VRDLGIYLHIPFCRRKCPYCEFFSLPSPGVPSDYLQALHGEVARWRHRLGPRRVETVYFGGGTPSLLPPSWVGKLLEEIDRRFELAAGAEITLEANPEGLSRQRLREYRRAGVNRLSLGLQALREERLRWLGRAHDLEQGWRALREAREVGFESLSLDLIFATPGQTEREWAWELQRALELAPDHLSLYELTLGPGSLLHSSLTAGQLRLPDEVERRRLYLRALEILGEGGFERYEVSNFCRPGWVCRHNWRYWERLEYVGMGAGACSFLRKGWGLRGEQPRDLEAYLRGEGPRWERLGSREALYEEVMLGLRTAQGLERRRLAPFGPPEEVLPGLVEMVEMGMLKWGDGCLRATEEGMLVLDEVILRLLP